MAFFGRKEQVLDDKNRVTFPSLFRNQIGADAELVLVPGLDTCIWVFARERFDEIERSFPDDTFVSEELRGFQRKFFGGVNFPQIDKQFRIVIPEDLKQHARLTKDVVIMGVRDRFEIWDVELCREHLEASDEKYEEFAVKIFTDRSPGPS